MRLTVHGANYDKRLVYYL